MATPKPGEIRCPTCHRSTPPAAFCTQCGSAIPSDARIRPRGMDRDELQDRIRARRVGGEPFRRGEMADEQGGYERFVPDEDDAHARRPTQREDARRDFLQEPTEEEPSAPEPWPREDRPPDLTRDRDDWARPAAAATSAASMPPPMDAAPAPSDVPMDEPAYVDNFDDEAYANDDYGYETWEERREPRSGVSAFAILGFLALGVLALGAGAVLAGIFGGAGVGSAPSPSPTVSTAPTVVATASPSIAPSGSASATGSPGASGNPTTFPDGFTAEVQPCLPGTARNDRGCDSNGASNSGAVEIWVSFKNGTGDDVIGATLVAPDGSTADGSIDLAQINCGAICQGYTWFNFANLDAGTYEVRVTRNGELAATTSFEVS